MKSKKGHVIAITSSKGGVGKTIFSSNLAGVYNSLQMHVLLIDMDLSSGGISTLLNLGEGKTIYNLADDILNNRFKNTEEYVYHYNELIDIIPSCKDPRQGSKMDSKIVEQIISIYKNNYDVLLLDTSHIPTSAMLTSLDMADKILFMVTDDPLDLKNSASFLKVLADVSKDPVVILNSSFRNEKSYFSKFDIKNVIKHNIDYELPSSMYIGNINKYIMEGEILVLNKNLSFKNNRDRELLIKMANFLVGDENE